MTKSTITRERLEKIKSWRETYGAGSNVMLPAEEAEELARIALAAMDSKPVAYSLIFRNMDGALNNYINTNTTFATRAKAEAYGKGGSYETRSDGRLEWVPNTALDPVVVPLYRHAQQPVIPDGYVMVPMRLTAENGAKGVLSGEFSETQFVNCPECFGDDECETCDGSGRIEITVPVTWTTIKEIWAKGVEHFAAAPQDVPDGK